MHGFGFAVSPVQSLSPKEQASQIDYSDDPAIKVLLAWITATEEFL